MGWVSAGLLVGCSSLLGIKEFPSDDGGAPEIASEAAPTSMPNCEPGGPGLSNCGSNQESCCTSLGVPGGTYDRVYTYDGDGGESGTGDAGVAGDATVGDGGPTGEANPATVSALRLDKYLVTVGRFRQFAIAWNAGYTPPAGSGKHTHLNQGQGLADVSNPGTFEPGWLTTDDSNIGPTDTNLTMCPSINTWTPTAGAQESLPIVCVNWWEAYAFCIWDGGFLPSEAEWEYVAAGGSQEREYPWGSTDPGTDNLYAIYGYWGADASPDCYYPSGALAPCTGTPNIAPVGTTTLGAGQWGQFDMAGEVLEWTADWYAKYVDPCVDCAYLAATSYRVTRGGDFAHQQLSPAGRAFTAPASRLGDVGFRCARTP
jgi:formylglycine-generating enzyme required for sulfatase activity